MGRAEGVEGGAYLFAYLPPTTAAAKIGSVGVRQAAMTREDYWGGGDWFGREVNEFISWTSPRYCVDDGRGMNSLDASLDAAVDGGGREQGKPARYTPTTPAPTGIQMTNNLIS